MKRWGFLIILAVFNILLVSAKKRTQVGEPYAWQLSQPLGTRYRVPIDTLHLNFYQTDQPISFDEHYAFTGNLGGPGFSRIFFLRKDAPQFIFKQPFSHYIVTPASYTFYNTRLPMTLLSYMSGASSENRNDDLKAAFSGNVNKKLGFGANIEYLYSRGYYDHQVSKNFNWQLSSNYKGDKYELNVLLNTYNIVCQENGGISDDAFILTPDDVYNGTGGVDSKSIPVNFNNAFNRVRGANYYASHRYKWGHYQTKVINDTLEVEEYVPIMSFIHTIEYDSNTRRFIDTDSAENVKNFANAYINKASTNDTTSYWTLKNTLGVSLLEGFNKRAKMGITAFATYELRRFKLMAAPVSSDILKRPSLPLLPGTSYYYSSIRNPQTFTENIVWVGGNISKRQGSLITYDINGKIGLTGPELGSVDIDGRMQTKFAFLKDSMSIAAYGFFKNLEPAFYYRKYVSNHYVWNNDFGKIRKFRVGGEIEIPGWGTYLNVGFENVQNYVYFNKQSVPQQESGNIQIFSATLKQRFKVSIVHLDLEAIYQASSNQSVIPLPTLSAYGNFYLLFKIAKVLHTQIGVDCRYNTAYYGEIYNPATLSFHVQDEYKVGNYPYMNVYANMKLKMVRFYVMYSHFNKGLFGDNRYFSMPHYPLNPGSFQFGVCVDFAN